MEPLSLALMAAAAGKVVEHLLGDGANKLVATVVGGVLGNHADRVVQGAISSSRRFFEHLRTQDPSLNHDLERATREAYLLATLELVRQAELRTELAASRLLTAGDDESLVMIRNGIDADLRDLDDTLPERLPEFHLLAVDPDAAPADRLTRLRQALDRNRSADLARWLRGRAVPAVLGELLTDGWVVSTARTPEVPRDWYSLIAIAFVEKLKTTPRLAAVFESRLLAQIAAREPAAAPIASFEGFTTSLASITAPLQRIEDALGVIGRDLGDIKSGVGEISRNVDDLGKAVGEIRASLPFVARLPRALWLSSALLLVTAVTVLASDGAAGVVCRVPGVRAACAQLAIGGVPTPVEDAVWRSRVAGDCSVLRAYLSRFPDGAYAEDASRRLGARVTQTEESWVPQEKTLPFTVTTAIEALPSEERARADALSRADREAATFCSPYAQDEFRLRAQRVVPDTWRCTPRPGGVACGFDGQVVCEVDARRLDAVERCE
jgi:hypothetical protein